MGDGVAVEAEALEVGLEHRHVGLLVHALPGGGGGGAAGRLAEGPNVAALHLVAGVVLVLPRQHEAARRGERVLQLGVVGDAAEGAVDQVGAHAGLEDDLALRVPHRGLHDVLVGLALARRAVDEAHGHVLRQVGAPLGHEHGEAEGDVLLVVHLHAGAHRAGRVLGLPVADAALAVEHAHGDVGLVVVGAVLRLKLRLRQRLQGVGQRVHVDGAGLRAQHVNAPDGEEHPRHVVLGHPAQVDAVAVGAHQQLDFRREQLALRQRHLVRRVGHEGGARHGQRVLGALSPGGRARCEQGRRYDDGLQLLVHISIHYYIYILLLNGVAVLVHVHTGVDVVGVVGILVLAVAHGAHAVGVDVLVP